jgi:hypothetical protein
MRDREDFGRFGMNLQPLIRGVLGIGLGAGMGALAAIAPAQAEPNSVDTVD